MNPMLCIPSENVFLTWTSIIACHIGSLGNQPCKFKSPTPVGNRWSNVKGWRQPLLTRSHLLPLEPPPFFRFLRAPWNSVSILSLLRYSSIYSGWKFTAQQRSFSKLRCCLPQRSYPKSLSRFEFAGFYCQILPSNDKKRDCPRNFYHGFLFSVEV